LSIGLRVLRAICIGALLPGCMVMAAPPPLMTVGGPATAPAGGAEVALGAGSGASLFPGAHGTGHGWFGRYRYGLSERSDLGVDLLGAMHDTATLTGKLALRYRLRPHWRIEGGLGVADDGHGKSANADLGLTVGSLRPERWWDYYGSLRVAGAHGYPGSLVGSGDKAPPDDAVFVGSAGASIRIQPNIHFVMEGGYSAIEIVGVRDIGQAVYVGTFLLMTTAH
jgi:hypothetical protein